MIEEGLGYTLWRTCYKTDYIRTKHAYIIHSMDPKFSQNDNRMCNKSQKYKIYNLLIPWNRVLLEKLSGFQLVQKFPTFYGTQRFITTFTRGCQVSLPCASLIES